MAIKIHYVPVHDFFWAESGKADKDIVKGAGFNWCDRSYGPKWCPPEESGINKVWWTKNYSNAYKLKDYLDPDAAKAINKWIESGSAKKDIKEAETPISIHYVPESKVFFADAGKRFAKTLKEAGFRWHDIEWSEHDISKCAACASKVPSKKWWTNNIDAAVNLINFTDAGAKEVLDKYLLLIEQSRAADYNINIPLPKGLKPYNYQKAGVAWASSRQNSLIADEMGLGKTIQALLVVNLDESIKTVVILCKAALKINWKKEAEKWLIRPNRVTIVNHVEDIPKRQSGDEKISVLVIGFPSVRGDYGEELYKKLMSFNFDLVIIDEAHNLKNPKALQTKNILGWMELKEPYTEYKGIADGAKRKIYLTGTPIKNRPIEGWTIFHSLAPEIFDNYIKYAFRYCDAYWEEIPVKGKGMTRTLNVKGSSNSAELQRKLRASIMIRRLKEDVLTELPPKTRELVLLEPDEKIRKLIEEEKRKAGDIDSLLNSTIDKAKSNEDYRKAAYKLEELAKARFSELSKIRHLLAVAKVEAAVDHIESMIEGMEEGKDKILIFAHHRDVIEALRDKLSQYNPVIFYGGMKDSVRDQVVESFQNDPNVKIFIGGISAAGEGLTLTASSTVVFCELDWSPSQILQCEDRAHRIGQKDNVFVQHLVFDGSLDAKIVKTFLDKMDVISKVLDVGAEVKKITIQDIPKVEPIPPPEELKPIPIPTIVQVEYKPGQPTESGGVVIDSDPSKPGKPPTKPTILEYTYTDEQKQAALQGIQMLAEVCDYAQTKDMMGFNIAFTKIGHNLASRDELTDKDMSGEYGAVHILNVHRRQMPDWIRDILGLWPNKEKAIYNPEQKRVIYLVAQLLNESPNKDDIFDEEELQLIKQIAETDISEKGDKTFSDKLLFVFRKIISEHWTDIDSNATALLEHVGVKRAKIRGKRGETSIEPTIPGEEELAEEKISEQPEDKIPSSIPVDFIEMGKKAYNKGMKRIPALDPELDKKLESINSRNEINKAYENWLKGWDTANIADVSWIDFVQMGKEAFLSGKPSVPAEDEIYNKNIEFLRTTKNKSKDELKKLTLDWMNGWREAQNAQVEVTKEKRKEQEESDTPFDFVEMGTKAYLQGLGRKQINKDHEFDKAIESLISSGISDKNIDDPIIVKATNDWLKGWDIANSRYPIIQIPEKRKTGEVIFHAKTDDNNYEIELRKENKTIFFYFKEFNKVTNQQYKEETQNLSELAEAYAISIKASAQKGINYRILIDKIGVTTKSEPLPESKTITKLTEPQKGGIYSIIVYFSTLPDSTIKKEFSSVEKKIFDKIENDLGEGKSWEILNDEQINELKRLIQKHINLVPKEYMNYLTATGVRLAQPSTPITQPAKQQRYTNQQKDIAYMSIVMLKKHFDSMQKKEKSQYTKEWVDNIDRIAQFSQPISDEQVDQIISIIKKHRRLFDEMGVFEKLGVKFAGRPPKK